MVHRALYAVLLVIAFVAGGVALGFGFRPRPVFAQAAEPSLPDVLAERTGPAEARAVVAALSLRLAAPARERAPADSRLALRTALVRARHFLATAYLTEEAQEEELLRAIRDGLTGLEPAVGRALADGDALDDVLAAVPASHAELLFFTALAFGSHIPHRSVFGQAGAAGRFERMVRRCVALDERCFHAGPHRVLASFLHEAPGFMGGDAAAAKVHARKAVELAPGYAENHLVLVAVEAVEGAARKSALERAAALGKAARGADAPEARRAGARAEALLQE